jgi:hypothetical protein
MHGVMSYSLQNLVWWRLIFVSSCYETSHPSGALNSEVASSYLEISALLV